MRLALLLIVVPISLPAVAQKSDQNQSVFVAISQCLQRASGSSTSETPHCDSIAPSVKQAAETRKAVEDGVPQTNINPCSGFSYRYSDEYMPIYVGKRGRDCIPVEQISILSQTVRSN